MRYFALLSVLLTTGCVDKFVMKIKGITYDSNVICYSGGKEIYRGIARSKISYDRRTAMWIDDKGEITMINADCISTRQVRAESLD